MVVVRAFPRVHISLLDLGNATPRRYGGSGFSIDGNVIDVSATLATRCQIDGLELLDELARDQVEQVIAAFRCVRPNSPAFQICIRNVPAQHVGFGTKTTLLLALLVAANDATGAGLKTAELQHLSGRGGTSGVGINLFFTGGFLCDLGHPNRSDAPFVPSSASQPAEVPPIACRFNIPNGWRFLLILPPGRRLAGAEEKLFFRRATPISRIDVLEAVAAMYHGVVPAILAANIDQLRSSLNVIHSIGFKRRELDEQSEAVRQIYHRLSAIRSLAVGLSSLGPLLYAVADDKDLQATETVKAICRHEGATFLGAFAGRNSGYEITYE